MLLNQRFDKGGYKVNVVNISDVISTVLYLIFWIFIIFIFITLFKRLNNFVKQQKEINHKLDTIIDILRNKQI